MAELAAKHTLKDKFVDEITKGVLSGKYPIGERLPPERELASQMGISRTVVRSGIAELAANGIVELRERQGCIVVDYNVNGRVPIFNAILTGGGEMSQRLLEDYLKGRILLESETARLAALERTNDDLYLLFTIIREGYDLKDEDIAGLAKQNFRFHRQVAIACKNTLYPIIMNSMEITVRKLFEENYCKEMKRTNILKLQERLYEAIQERDPNTAVLVMVDICNHRMP